MKKLGILLTLVFAWAIVSAQTVEMSYSFEKPTVTQLQGYEQIQLRGCMQSALVGQPSLPWQSVSLMLPPGQEAASIEVILSDFQELEGQHEIFPYQPSRISSDNTPRDLVKDEELYASKSTYPLANHGRVTTQYKNGYGFAFSAFTPVQYIPSTGKVMVARKANVRVNLTAAKADHSAMLWGTQEIKNSVMRLAQNPEMIDAYQTKGREVTAYDVLIITAQDYVNAYQEYRDYYNAIGLRNRIATTADIYANTTGNDNQDKIRNYIIQEYQNNGIMMVVLGGDVNIIPYRGFFCQVQSSSLYESNDIPADLYYCGLDGTWDDNGNNNYGEPDEDDLLPEIGMSRMSFQNSTDLSNMINKTLSYQQNPVLGEFHKVILAGEHLYDNPNTNGSDYLELLIGTRSDNGYTTTGFPTTYDFTKLYDENGNWSGSLLRQAINAGTSYVHHNGHANSGYVAGWYSVSNDDFSGANGTTHNYTFFHSQGCDCGAFDENCILEKMVKIQNFAVAVIGNSRYGWFNEGQTEGPGCHLEREMTDAQFNDRIDLLGNALSESKTMTAPWVNAPGQWEEGALRWNFYDINVLGDGAVSVWLDEPFTAMVEYPNQVVVGTQSINVTVNDSNGIGQKNFRCLVYRENQVIAMGVTDENGVAQIAFEGGIADVGEMTMKITGLNAWPQEVSLMAVPSDTPYIVYESHVLANGAGQIDFGGNYAFNMVVNNVGSVGANNVTATLTCDSEHITITQPTVSIGNVNGNQSINLDNVFAFSVSDNVPNNTLIRFNLTCTDGNEVWESHFNARAYAPEFEVTRIILETPTGSYLNPGDSGILHFNLRNCGGATAPSAVFEIFNSHAEITTGTSQWHFDAIEPNQVVTADLSFTLGNNTHIGVMYELPYAMYYGNYGLNDSYYLAIGQTMDGFETGDFSVFNWHQGSVITAWEVVTDYPYQGQYCARSSSIGNNESSVLYVDVETNMESEISFYYKVSSEAGYDKLYFMIDDVEKSNWSGEVQWTLASYPLTVGTHRLKWVYSKDVAVTSGQDCAWIDNVVLPPSEIIAISNEVSAMAPVIYPNPNKGSFHISLPEEDCDLAIYNSLGQLVYCQEKASGLTALNLETLGKGLYFVTVQSASGTSTQKFVKQ